MEKCRLSNIITVTFLTTMICYCIQSAFGQTEMKLSDAALIALDSTTAQIRHDQFPITGLTLKPIGIVYSLEPDDAGDYYFFMIVCDIGEDNMYHGKIYVDCSTGNVLPYATARKSIHPAHEFYHTYCNEDWVREVVAIERPEISIEWWSLVRVTMNTRGYSQSYRPGIGKLQTVPISEPMGWLPPTVMVVDSDGKSYFITRSGDIRDVTDLDPEKVERIKAKVINQKE